MATITDADFKQMRSWARSKTSYRRTWQLIGISTTAIKAVLQAVEDYSVGSYTTTPTETLKDAMETAAGQSLTVSQAKGLWYAWASWKSAQET